MERFDLVPLFETEVSNIVFFITQYIYIFVSLFIHPIKDPFNGYC